MYLKTKNVTKESQYSTKIKYCLLIRFLEEHIFEIQPSHVVHNVIELNPDEDKY